MSEVWFKANGGETSGYLAQPASGKGTGVVVLQEWWGLDDHIRWVCDRLATAGLFALAPDLYGGVEPTTQPDEAQQRMMALSMDRAEKDMIAATVSYYYVMPHGRPDFSTITGPLLGHFGRHDEFVSLADARALEAELSAAGVDTTFEFYDSAGHAFFNDANRLGTRNPDLAASSWKRTVSFLRDHLTQVPA
jgi:carboxymethylenebutenolidase